MPPEFYFKIQYLYFNFDEKNYIHTSSQNHIDKNTSQWVKSQTQISDIWSQSATAHFSHSTAVST